MAADRSPESDIPQLIGVVGLGQMGSGIAQVAATAGFQVIARDTSPAFLDKGRLGIEKSTARLAEKGRLASSDREAALARIQYTTDLGALAACSLVIEAVTEDLSLKNEIWQQLDRLCPATTIFASNTSSLSIAAMAAATSRPDRFAGLH
ncbi:MAG TPA: 3-hydroxyacyl-CoA dehydrogenase NAD-binding domain-containing protein, partial [Gemmatimonadales bacterium]|nr:3-hydroxyacyl-CoA dehydrogenase NAD-binding domain-containing protein [Gemmatimonadales bacterium]